MKNKMKKEEKGITLIALVITIIVLLILAGVSISMLSGENGILHRAAEAKEETERTTMLEKVQLAVLAAQASGNGDINLGVLNSELKEAGYEGETISSLPKAITIGDYEYTIQKDGKVNEGNVVVGDDETGAKWAYKEDTNGRKTIITNGTVELKIGDYVSYDPTFSDKEKTEAVSKEYTSPTGDYQSSSYASIPTSVEQGSGYSDTQTFANTAETNGWRVLGVDEETGKLQIISADPIQTTGSANYYLRGYTGAMYGEEELNKICEIFGHGYGASSARSVNVDDVNKITGYNPSNEGVYDPEQTGSGTPYGSGQIYEYGNRATYSWNTTSGYIKYSGTNGVTGTNSSYASNYTSYGFNWLDATSNVGYTEKWSSEAPITTLTSTGYYYYPYSLGTSSSGTEVGISTTSKEYLTLFCNKAGSKVNYWLASPYVDTYANYAGFGLHSVYSDGYVSYYSLYNSRGYIYSGSYGVRPVVSLKSGITLSGNSTDGWTLE